MKNKELSAYSIPTFEETFDVVVVGYGYAGAYSAITAADSGARVLLAEKETLPGGISICSGGNTRGAHDAEAAFAYLKETNAGRTPDDVLRVLAEGLVGMEDEVRNLAAASGATVSTRDKGGNYPFTGHDTFYHINVTCLPGRDDSSEVYPHMMARPSANGWRVFRMLEDEIERRDNITVRCAFPAERLIANDQREVLGVWFRTKDGRRIAVKARCGVVLACGGFEANEEMKQQYWEKAPVLSATSDSNTGDGIRMAQDLGAELWHMWHYHGSYGFKHPDPAYPMAIRVKRLPDWFPGRERTAKVKMCWIVVGQDGLRYMNESAPYMHDTTHRPMELFDTVQQKFPRIPSHLIYDENGRKMYQIGAPTYNKEGLDFAWSEDNLREVDLGIIKKADSVEALARHISVEPAMMQETLDHWNEFCRRRCDEDFGRPPGTMARIDTPPYYVAQVWPIVSNTQGGPVHNANQQIINVFGEPIPRLYAAGELGSSFGYLYISGVNVSECVVTGRIAGREAAQLAHWDLSNVYDELNEAK